MSRSTEDTNRRMLRARDAMDRAYAEPLDVPALARIAHVSPTHFTRTFRATFGETPHRYLQRRRVELAMYLLRETDLSVTEICFGSLGTLKTTRHCSPAASSSPKNPPNVRTESTAPSATPSAT
ncbi:helix-turn-helix domain-containing protein [Actinoplanes aureus]|uniref:Helix-turn-helix transcriptional regulator n=1 Tax=Actinoplanes aureus TaxID=2792083 RepID=A0A931CDV5_9ACTN|nr:AraC family transcriptional regulator [Actinoplanes aureus]MBG0563095.1 helix-turn-helix transcriptional regulator [Actinoplanes aureus]